MTISNRMGRATLFGLLAVAAMAVPAAAENRMYVPLGDANTIAIIDTDRHAVTGTIDGAPAVHGLAGTRDGRLLVAGSMMEREAGSEMPTKPAGVSAEDHAAHHGKAAGDAPKSDDSVSTVSIISTADKTVVRRIDVPGAVHHVAISPGGRYAALTHPGGDGISVIDLLAYRVVATVKTGAVPNYAVFSPDGKSVYVTNAGDGTVAVVDSARWTTRRTIKVGSSPEHLVMAKDGRTLYVNNVDDGTVSVVSLKTNAVRKTIRAGKDLHGIDLSDDGGTLFVSARGEDKLVALDLGSGKSRTIPLAPAPYHLAAVRGAGTLYVSSADQPKIWVVDQKSLAVVGEIPVKGKAHQMVPALMD